MLNAAPASADDATADGTALIMGYSGTPDPAQSYVDEVMKLFIPSTANFTGQPLYPGYDPVIQVTTENDDYYSGLTQGVGQLDQGISQYLPDGKVAVFGYSESSSIATQEMINLDNLPKGQAPDPNDLSFVLTEDLNNPNGGIFTRFPFTGLPATPSDTPYHTDIYTLEYSGTSDFPNDPTNFLAETNAMAGYVFLHPFLIPGWPTSFDPSDLADAVREPVSQGYNGATDYFLIPTQNLPLLAPLRAIPVIGPAMADEIQPDLRVLVDLGYNRADPADVATPADVSSPSIDWTVVDHNLQLGQQQGMTAAEVDLGMLPQSDMPNIYPFVPDLSGLMSDPGMTGLTTASSAADVSPLAALLGDLGGNLDITTLLSDFATLF